MVAGSNLTVNFSTTGTFNNGNTFSAVLSDAAGTSFTTALTIVSSTATSLTVTIPANTVAGTTYKVRVDGSNPITTGTPSGNFEVTAPTATPTLTANPTALTGFTYVEGFGPSATQIYRLTGNNLPANSTVTVTAPTNYEVSQDNATFGSGFTVSNFSATDVYVRLKGGLPVDTYNNELVVNTGGGAAQLDVPLSGSVTPPNPVPAISSLSPNTAVAGSGNFTLTVNGTGFISGSTVSFNGTNRVTTFVSATRLTAAILAADIATAGTYDVVVTNAAPGGGASAAASFTVTAPVATLTATQSSLSFSAQVGTTSTAQSYTLNGSNLPASSTVTITAPAAFELSVTSATAGFAGSQTATTTAAGSLSRQVWVRFVAPASPGTTGPADVTNVVGSTSVAVAVTGNATAAPAASTYTWSATGGTGNWSSSSSWSPARTAPQTTDILVFDGQVTPTAVAGLDMSPTTQTIGQLRFINNVTADLTLPSGDRTLIISGNQPGPDFEITSGSVTRFLNNATTGARDLILDLQSGQTGLVAGRLEFDGNVSRSGAHRLVARGANAVEFTSTGYFRAGTYFSGNPFGTNTASASAVVFRSGATFEQNGGANPFGLTAPASVVVFESGSRYYINGLTTATSFNGRTFPILEIRQPAGNNTLANLTGGSGIAILNDLIVQSGNVGMNFGSTSIGGNITVNGGQLTFDNGNEVIFNGTTPQIINGTGTNPVLVGPTDFFTLIRVSNPAGLTIAYPVVSDGDLDFDGGKITTSYIAGSTPARSTLQINELTVTTGSSNTAFVDGPLSCLIEAGGNTNVTLSIGKGSAFRPIRLQISAQGNDVIYTAEQINMAPASPVLLGDLRRVSRIRYYSIVPNVIPTAFSGNITLSFGTDDQVTDPTATSLVVAKNNGSGWENIGHSTATGTADAGNFVPGTLTSGTFTSFSDFALASTDPDVTNNPLPVELIRFTAQRQTNAVRLDWATASEQNNARFEVQRSADGAQFRTLATVAGQGTTAQRHTYSALDRQPLPGTAYYRLRQVDTNGQASFSPVVAVAAGKELSLYPNPAHTELQVVAPAPEATYRVLSTIGAVMLEGKTSTGTATLNVAALPAGLYHLEVTTAAGRVMRKFTRQD
ncbi:T9SS type A sorting domain-containing protein [Hymenobacter canadensis]|uniref:T9SS type A sorting domain-containing protein n=1 Tax=Hymenobacter canadensis TaxID=2999067 RepID=A0ABY7LUP6_9BACT|nr:T9SS type A sorting domain-containing protein [Hymenobacter canadensis]WBA43574.1 T9SS type A sorting domain-containing protein [Hymenobacter canadensis]